MINSKFPADINLRKKSCWNTRNIEKILIFLLRLTFTVRQMVAIEWTMNKTLVTIVRSIFSNMEVPSFGRINSGSPGESERRSHCFDFRCPPSSLVLTFVPFWFWASICLLTIIAYAFSPLSVSGSTTKVVCWPFWIVTVKQHVNLVQKLSLLWTNLLVYALMTSWYMSY